MGGTQFYFQAAAFTWKMKLWNSRAHHYTECQEGASLSGWVLPCYLEPKKKVFFSYKTNL